MYSYVVNVSGSVAKWEHNYVVWHQLQVAVAEELLRDGYSRGVVKCLHSCHKNGRASTVKFYRLQLLQIGELGSSKGLQKLVFESMVLAVLRRVPQNSSDLCLQRI